MLIDFIQSIALFVISGSCLFGYWTTHRRVARLEQELFRLDERRRTSGRG